MSQYRVLSETTKLVLSLISEKMIALSGPGPHFKAEEEYEALQKYWALVKEDIGPYGARANGLGDDGRQCYINAEHYMKLLHALYGAKAG